jgi:sterol desaturase/sphingolipid hydroxylase (fatty acid hydroxylase superfamily)
VTGVLAWQGWVALAGYGPLRSIGAGQWQLAGPAVLLFVLVMVTVERQWPAQPRPLLAPGHRLDLFYLVLHGALVVPVIVLVGKGFATQLQHAAPWLVIPRVPQVPRAAFVIVALLGIDAVDWLAHLANHRLQMLWRLHALHHSQEELSILTAFRTHPLVHASYVISAVPVLVLAANAATPAVLLTTYACLGALPHANVRWTYGGVGRWVVSPAYHRLHHAPVGRLDVNMGTVFTVWDRLSGRAVFPVAAVVPSTGLAGRPIPVEQSDGGPGPALGWLVFRQLADPFLSEGSRA